jgi:type VI secretion system secreted protein VgrG
MSTPASAALVAAQGMQFAAQENINGVAGKNADWSVLKRFTVAAGEKISLFARNGLKIFAAKGPVDVQAQSGAMSLTADKDVTVASVNGKLSLAAAKELILECGGAFIHFKNGSITLGGPGDLFLKTITVQKKGKDSIHIPLPALPITHDQRLFSNLVDLADAGFATVNSGHAWANLNYLVADTAGNNLASGTLDGGATGSRFFSREPKDVDVWVGTPGWEPAEETLSDDDSEAEDA